MKKKISDYKYEFVFAVIIVVQICVMMFYESHKEFYHIDELYTFEYSHNIMPDSSVEGDYRIRKQDSWYDQWHSKEEFMEHFEVQGDDSVLQHSLIDFLQNKQSKNIYYIALNIASSLQKSPEPNKWTAFYLNVIIFCITQIFVYKIAYEIIGNKKKALLAVLLYGFSAGATSLTLYVRFYDLCLLSATLISYFHIKIWKMDKIWKQALYLLGVAMAALMVYENQPYVMTYTACAVLAYLITGLVKKQKKKIMQYVGLLSGGIAASIVVLNSVWKRLITLAGGEYGRTAIENILGRNWNDYYEYMKYYFQKLRCHTLAGGKVSLCIAILLGGIVLYSFFIRKKILKTGYKTEYILMIFLNCILFFLIQCRLLENFEYRYMSYYYPGVCILAAVSISYVFDAIKCKEIYSYLMIGCILILQIATIYRKGYVEEIYPEAAEMRQVLEGYGDCDSILFIEARHAHQYYRDAFLIPDGTDFCAVESLQALEMNYDFLDREDGRPVLCWFPNFYWNKEDDNYKALDKIVNETEYSSYYKILETYQSMVYYLY